MMLNDGLSQAIAAGCATVAILAYIVVSVTTNSKSLASLIQLGELQRRQEVHDEILQSKPPSHADSGAVLKRQQSLATAVISTISSSGRKSFTVGVVNLCLTAYVMGAAPTLFYLWYTPKAIVLISLRWVRALALLTLGEPFLRGNLPLPPCV